MSSPVYAIRKSSTLLVKTPKGVLRLPIPKETELLGENPVVDRINIGHTHQIHGHVVRAWYFIVDHKLHTDKGTHELQPLTDVEIEDFYNGN